MPDPRIGIEIELLGKNVLNELKQIQDVLNDLNKKTFRVTVSDAGGVGKILTKLDEVVEAIKFVNGTTVSPKVDDSPFKRMKSSISDVRKEASALNSEMRNVENTMRSISGLLTGADWYMGPNAQGMRFSEMAFMNAPNLRRYAETVAEAYSIMSRYRNMPNYPRLGYTAPYGYLGANYNYSSLYPVPSGFNYPWEYTIFSTQAPNWTWGRGKEFGGYLTGAVREVGKSFDDANESANNLYRTLSNRAYSVSESARNFSDLAGSLSSFSYNAANLFDMISSFGFGSQVNTVISTLTSQFTGSITGGISNAYERYDVFVRYPRIMESFGISIEDASVALDRLNTAVLGLPTSLNDIAQSSTEFVAILSGYGYEGADLLNRSADLAIAVNNAVLASGASEADASYAMQQLQNFIATGQLTSNQWRSLRRTIPVALSEIAKDMGFNSYVEMRNAIVSGDKSMNDFIDSLIRLGTNDGPIAQLADISKLTLNAISANIKNAFSRLIAGRINEQGEIEGGLLGSLNQITQDRYGEALPEYIKNRIIPRIDAFSSVLSNAILTHEDEIFAFVDRVLAYDWEGLIGKIAKLLSYRWDILLSLFEKIPQGLLAFATVGASDIAKILRLLGVFSMMASIISRFNAGVMSKAASRLFSTGVPGMILPKGSSFAGSAGAAGAEAAGEAAGGASGGLATLGGLGKFGLGALGAYVLLEQAYLWSKAGKNTGAAFNSATFDYINKGRRSFGKETDKRYDTISSYAYYLPKMTDPEDIRNTIAYLNEALPGINLRWDEINKKVTVNGDLIDNLPEYIDAYIAKLREADKITEATMRRQELSEKVTEARSTRDSARAALEEGLTKFGFNPADFFDENGNILASAFSEAAQSLSGLDGMELTNLRSQFELARADTLALEKEWRAYDNMIKMSEEEWPALVDEFRHKYGEIPEEVMEMIEDGTVTIPTNMEELIALCVRAVEEGRLPEAFLKELGIAEGYISNDSAGISAAAGTLGANAGESMGSNLFSHVQWWLNSIQGAVSSVKFDKNPPSGGFDKNPGGSKNTKGIIGVAFGGRIYRQGGTDKDTVLTWLQPGEYVLRKKAADKLGGDILNKLNNFNFKGAVQALSERVGAGMSPYAYAGATGNTRIYNNNAQATINVNNATQEFTQRRASKWVRGLK